VRAALVVLAASVVSVGFAGPSNPHDVDLDLLVPPNGRIEAVWYVPAGRGAPQITVAWHRGERHVLTLWTRVRGDRWGRKTLIRSTRNPLVGRTVRLADVTGDGHADLLVTVLCAGCNHSTADASVYATVGRKTRRLYHRHIAETAWGAKDGLVWFDTPRGGTAVCCPEYRLQTFMRWRPGGWRTVLRRRAAPADDPLILQGWPYP
jgi:hypothetical protein